MSHPTPSWPRIKAHAQETIEQLRTALEGAAPDAVPRLQAEIRVWRQVIDLPATLHAEPLTDEKSGY